MPMEPVRLQDQIFGQFPHPGTSSKPKTQQPDSGDFLLGRGLPDLAVLFKRAGQAVSICVIDEGRALVTQRYSE